VFLLALILHRRHEPQALLTLHMKAKGGSGLYSVPNALSLSGVAWDKAIRVCGWPHVLETWSLLVAKKLGTTEAVLWALSLSLRFLVDLAADGKGREGKGLGYQHCLHACQGPLLF
jgi:hypothetical protein